MADPASPGPSSFGSSLLAKSKASPGSIDMSIFAPKSKPVGQGAVSSDYLQKTREDNPEPESSQQQSDSVILGVCKITTPVADLSTDQPFEMSVEAKGAGTVTFNLFCTLPKSDGTEEVQDQSSPSQGTIADGVAKAKGNLVSPKTPVQLGTKLKYHVVAEHPDATEKSTSDKVEVESGKPPKPLASLTLGAVHFGFNSSFVLPSAAEKIAEFQKAVDANPGAAVAVFGHADPTGDDDPNKALAGRRAYAVYCLLAKKDDGWSELAKGDKWDLHTTQTMLRHLKDETGVAYYGGGVDGEDGPLTQAAVKAFQKASGLAVDGVAGPKTHAALYAKYMDEICPVTCAPEDFVGDPQDTKRQWACVGCGEFNPLLVFGQADADQFAKATDKSERDAKNSPNRRATIFLFPATAKGPGKVQFPCPARDEGTAKCKAQFFDDGDKRRNPQDAERTWEKDQNTFACKFYAAISKESGESATTEISFHLHDERHRRMPNTEYELLVGGMKRSGTSDAEGKLVESGVPALDEATIRWGLASALNPPTHDTEEILRRRSNPRYLHERKIVLFKAGTSEDSDYERMLLNLGYVDDEFPVNWANFQTDFGLAAAPFPDPTTKQKLQEVYSRGAEPPSPPDPIGPFDETPEEFEEDGPFSTGIEIVLEDHDSNPIAEEPWEIHDGSGAVLDAGTLDSTGRAMALGIADEIETFIVFPRRDASSFQAPKESV